VGGPSEKFIIQTLEKEVVPFPRRRGDTRSPPSQPGQKKERKELPV
jgi:hypothetical protein